MPPVSPAPAILPLVFDTLSGNVRRFVQGVGVLCGAESVALAVARPQEGFVLATYTFGSGEVPASTARFLEQYGHLLRGVVVSGSYHWGERFGRAGDLIAGQYRIPLIARINKAGSAADRETVAGWLRAEAAERGSGRNMYGTLD